MLNPGILDRMMIAAFQALNPAWPLLINDVKWLLSVVSTLYLLGLCGVAMGGGLDAIPQMAKAMGKHVGVVWVVTNAQTVAYTLINLFAGLGRVLSGTEMTAAEFALPGRILWQGQDLLQPLMDYIAQLSFLDYMTNTFQIQFMTIAMWVTWLGFAVFALNMMYQQVQTLIVVLINFVKIAFVLFAPTRFLAMDGIEAMLSRLFRLATLSLIVGFSTPWFQWLAFRPNEAPDYWGAWAVMTGAWTIVLMAFAGPRALEVHGASLISSVAGVAYGVARGVTWGRR